MEPVVLLVGEETASFLRGFVSFGFTISDAFSTITLSLVARTTLSFFLGKALHNRYFFHYNQTYSIKHNVRRNLIIITYLLGLTIFRCIIRDFLFKLSSRSVTF